MNCEGRELLSPYRDILKFYDKCSDKDKDIERNWMICIFTSFALAFDKKIIYFLNNVAKHKKVA